MSEAHSRSPVRKVFTILRRLFLILVGAFVMLVFFGEIPFQFVGLLLFGWVAFLQRVTPQITFNSGIAFDAVVALALALFGLHRILRWWMKQRGGEAMQWRFGWTAKITLMVLLLFMTSISAVGIVHQIAWLSREPRWVVMGGRGRLMMELSSVKQLATAARLYSMDNKDRFPPQLDALLPDYAPSPGLLYTRGVGGDAAQPFLYFPGYGSQDDPATIIVASPRPMGLSGGGRRAVVHIDGSGGILREEEFQELIQKQHPPAPAQ